MEKERGEFQQGRGQFAVFGIQQASDRAGRQPTQACEQ